MSTGAATGGESSLLLVGADEIGVFAVAAPPGGEGRGPGNVVDGGGIAAEDAFVGIVVEDSIVGIIVEDAFVGIAAEDALIVIVVADFAIDVAVPLAGSAEAQGLAIVEGCDDCVDGCSERVQGRATAVAQSFSCSSGYRSCSLREPCMRRYPMGDVFRCGRTRRLGRSGCEYSTMQYPLLET